MLKIAMMLLVLSMPAFAQTYPSPTFQNTTTLGNATIGGTLHVTGATTIGGFTQSGTANFTGTLPTGIASTYACFTSGGELISSASPC